MALTFDAAVLRGYDSAFAVEEVVLRTGPADGEVLVRIAGCGMCRTDLAVRGSAGRSPLPAVLGHEGSGVVVQTGGPDTGLDPGDHVVLSFDSCGRCRTCAAGAPAYCDSFAALNLFGGRREHAGRFTDAAGGPLAPRWFGQSAFAEYAVVAARNTVRVDPALPVELLGPLGCGFLTGAGAVLHTFRAGPGDSVVVLGAGAVGLAAVMAATAAGATVVAVDRHRERLASAERLGAVPVPAAPAGFSTTWSDDFDGAAGTGLDTGTWRYDAGAGWTFGTGEIETMTDSTANVYQDGSGHLVLKALHSGTDPASGWTSGRVETQADGFGARPGGVVRVQASIQQPNLDTTNGAGYWPAFWMLGSPLRVGVGWPGSGEVDIMEDINARSSVFGTLHCGVSPGGPCNESTGIGSGERACSGCQTGYHTYAVEIDRSTSPEQIRYYLDGQNYFTVNSGQVDAATWANAVDHSFYVIFDLAIGGAFPGAFGGGPTAATASGGQMNVDYVAVYNKPAAGDLGPDIALGRPTTSSSNESADFPASNATDGDISTRWSSGFADPQWLQVDLGRSYDLTHAGLTWEAAAAAAYQLQVSSDGQNWTTVATNANSPQDLQDIALHTTGRYVRVYATARASQYGDSLYELALYGTPSDGSGPGGQATLLSQGRAATASSAESAAFPASAAVDGDAGTRWSSGFADPQWLQVDLGATHTISQVKLDWETAYGTAFQLQTSPDGRTWTSVYSTTSGTGGDQTLSVAGSGRYVRLYGTQRATQYGYSLWEFQVYGT